MPTDVALQTLNDFQGDHLSATIFRAVADGATHCDTNFANAFLALAAIGGGSLLVPRGRSFYAITAPLAPAADNIRLVLQDGAEIRNINAHGGCLEIVGVQNCGITGGVLTASNGSPVMPTNTTDGVAILVSGGASNISIENCQITGHEFAGVNLSYCSYVTIQNCTFYGGVNTTAETSATPTAEVMAYGDCQFCRIDSCTMLSFNDFGIGWAPGIGGNVKYCVADKCIIENKNRYGAVLYGLVSVDTTISSSITGSSTPQDVTPASMTGIAVGEYLSIANADGTNQEWVLVTAITGMGTSFTAVILTSKTGPDIAVTGNIVQFNSVTDCKIKNISSRDSGPGPYNNEWGEGIYVTSADDNLIAGNTLENCLLGRTGATLPFGAISINAGSRNIIAYNHIYTSNKRGIHIASGGAQPTYFNIVDGNEIYHSQQQGIYVDASTNNTQVSKNVVSSILIADFQGIYLASAADVKVSGNYVSGATAQGVIADENCRDISIDGNTVEYSGTNGIQAACSRVRVTGNTCRNNSQASSGVYSGIAMSSPSPQTGIIVIGNRCFDDQGTPTQGYGFSDNGTYSDIVLISNQGNGNAIGLWSLSSTDYQSWGNDTLANQTSGQPYDATYLQQATANLTDGGNPPTFTMRDSSVGTGQGGAIGFAAGPLRFAAIKGLLGSGTGNGNGDLAFATRTLITDTNLTERLRINARGATLVNTTTDDLYSSLQVGGAMILSGIVFASLGVPGTDGVVAFCPDAKNFQSDGAAVGSIAVGGGHGSILAYTNGQWRTMC